MEKQPKRDSENIFGDDELDAAIIDADDTGLVQSQHEITQEELLREVNEEQ